MTHQSYLSLISLINHHNHLYYVESSPSISDAEFDSLFLQLQQAEAEHPEWVTPDSPTQRPGTDTSKNSTFRKVTHATPMLSLAKAYSHNEVAQWISSLPSKSRLFADSDQTLSVECKYDGISLSLIYKRGMLIDAVTRGDGTVGDDVTAQAYQIPTIPHTLPAAYWQGLGLEDIEVRGEVLMPYAAFDEYNHTATDKAANPRNLCSGTMKSLDPHLCRQRGLVFVAYTLILPKACLDYRSQAWDIQALEQMGFQITIPGFDGLHMYTNSLPAILQKLDYIEGIRSQLPYPIDGVVIKVSNKVAAGSFGSTGHHPNHSVAYKFPAKAEDGNVKATHLRSIEFSLANSGKVTPVAITDEVNLYGTKVHRFSLASYKKFNEMAPWHKGDTLAVTKGGEITPKILTHRHDGTGSLISFPKTCPCCGTPLSIEGAYAFCRNPKCRHQLYTSTKERKANAAALTSNLFPAALPTGATAQPLPLSSRGGASLSGLSIVVSGTFSSPARKQELKRLVSQHGGTLQSAVSGKTTHLLGGSGVGPSKLAAAQRLGVTIITESQFLQMIG